MELEVVTDVDYEVKSFEDPKEAFEDLFKNRPDMIVINSKKCPLHVQMVLLMILGAIQKECRKKHKKIYRPVVTFM